eukprot:7412569-Alexandrium_andersonii.AAC.1
MVTGQGETRDCGAYSSPAKGSIMSLSSLLAASPRQPWVPGALRSKEAGNSSTGRIEGAAQSP